jgi:hypothetical protein
MESESREAAAECSPQRKLWVKDRSMIQAPEGRKKRSQPKRLTWRALPVWGGYSCVKRTLLSAAFDFDLDLHFVILNLAEKSVRACPERSQRESASDFGWRSAFSAAINEWEGHDFSRAVKRPWMEGFSPLPLPQRRPTVEEGRFSAASSESPEWLQPKHLAAAHRRWKADTVDKVYIRENLQI